MAVFNLFDIPMKVVYLDNSDSDNTSDFILPEGQDQKNIWLQLLYRPGHYDLIYS